MFLGLQQGEVVQHAVLQGNVIVVEVAQKRGIAILEMRRDHAAGPGVGVDDVIGQLRGQSEEETKAESVREEIGVAVEEAGEILEETKWWCTIFRTAFGSI